MILCKYIYVCYTAIMTNHKSLNDKQMIHIDLITFGLQTLPERVT